MAHRTPSSIYWPLLSALALLSPLSHADCMTACREAYAACRAHSSANDPTKPNPAPPATAADECAKERKSCEMSCKQPPPEENQKSSDKSPQTKRIAFA